MTVTKTTSTEPAAATLLAVLLLGAAACGPAREGHDAGEGSGAGGSWSVTAWGERYEVFPEIDALAAGETAEAHVHVTALDTFAPVEEGSVAIVLADEEGRERSYRADRPARSGIFAVEVRPERPGEYGLSFRVSGPAGDETIRGGRVRVGTAEDPGGVVRAPAPRGAAGGGEPIPFLKEQQWQAAFGTAWVRRSPFARSVGGQGVVRPVAGGETWITAPVAGTLRPEPWPWPGRAYPEGAPLFRLLPAVSREVSLAELRADASVAREELEAARRRLERLETLIEAEATSEREVQEARTRVEALGARVAAADEDLAAVAAAREGRGGAPALDLRAPFAGQVARLEASPGASVEAGERLARLVRVDAAWLEVVLAPADARRVAGGVAGAVLPPGSSAGAPEVRFVPEEVELVSVAPEVDPATGKIPVLVELPGRTGLALGSTHEVRLLLEGAGGADDDGGGGRPGIVVPASALVDDGGVTVVYLQLASERFVRQEVRVLERQGDRILVDGLVPGQRLVTEGGEAIRRETLLSSAAAHGHVH